MLDSLVCLVVGEVDMVGFDAGLLLMWGILMIIFMVQGYAAADRELRARW